MVLNILMRWPALIVALIIGGTGTVVYEQFVFPQAVAALKLEAVKAPTVNELVVQEPPRLEQNTMVQQVTRKAPRKAPRAKHSREVQK